MAVEHVYTQAMMDENAAYLLRVLAEGDDPEDALIGAFGDGSANDGNYLPGEVLAIVRAFMNKGK